MTPRFPGPLVPSSIKAWPGGWLEAAHLIQVGAAAVVDNLPEVQTAVIQQCQEAALVCRKKLRLDCPEGHEN